MEDSHTRAVRTMYSVIVILSHLSSPQQWPHFIGTESALWGDPVRPVRTARPTSFWLVAATANRVVSLQRSYCHSAQIRMKLEMRGKT